MSQRILILFLLLHCGLARARQRILEGPSDVVSRLGQTIVLKCRVENQEGAVQWLKNGFGLGSTRDLALYDRYSMIGRSSLGEYHLQIENATFDDEAQYECHIEETQHSASQTSAAAKLQITSEPMLPTLLTNQSKLSLQEGHNIELKCQSRNGRPATQLAWLITTDRQASIVRSWLGNASVILKGTKLASSGSDDDQNAVVQEEVDQHPNGLITVTSHLSYPVSKTEDQKFVACVAIHPTYGTSHKITTLPLDVLYMPAVTISLDESRSNLEEGGQAVLTCHVEAKPSNNLKIRWTKNDQPLEATGPHSVIVQNLRMEDHGHKIMCYAENAIGRGEASYKLNVNYGPRIMTTSQTKAVQRGESATFVCEATGNPEPSIRWVQKSNSDLIIAKGNKLTIDAVQPWQVGEYDCVASVPGFSDMTMSNFLHLKGPPMIEFSERLIKHEDSKVVMTCQVRGKPFPKHITWHRNGRAINFDTSNGRIQAQEVHREFGMESKLTILQVTESDYGIYNCSGVNEFGSHSMATELKQPSFIQKIIHYSNLNIIALLAFALVLLMLIILCVCCRPTCCQNKKVSRFNDDPSDVTVRCEALDGVQFFGGDVYSTGDIENSEIVSSKDYISIPQNNPDLDYLPPPSVIYQGAHGYVPHHVVPHDYASSDGGARYEASFNSFLPNQTSNGHVVDMYGNTYLKHPGSQLETLSEVATPDTESGTPLLVPNIPHDRAVSQMSTHV